MKGAYLGCYMPRAFPILTIIHQLFLSVPAFCYRMFSMLHNIMCISLYSLQKEAHHYLSQFQLDMKSFNCNWQFLDDRNVLMIDFLCIEIFKYQQKIQESPSKYPTHETISEHLVSLKKIPLTYMILIQTYEEDRHWYFVSSSSSVSFPPFPLKIPKYSSTHYKNDTLQFPKVLFDGVHCVNFQGLFSVGRLLKSLRSIPSFLDRKVEWILIAFFLHCQWQLHSDKQSSKSSLSIRQMAWMCSNIYFTSSLKFFFADENNANATLGSFI